MSGGGGKGSEETSQQQSTSTSRAASGSFVDPAQAGYLNTLRSMALPLAQQQMGQIGGVAQGLASQLGGVGQQALGALGTPNAGFQAAQDALAGFNPQAMNVNAPAMGAAVQANAPQLGGQFIQGSIDRLGADINQQLQRQIGGAGGINTAFAGSGTLGGGLGGGQNAVARGIAQEGALDAFATGAANLRQQDAAQRQALLSQQALQNAAMANQQNQFGAGQQLAAGLANQQAGTQANQQQLQALLGGGQFAGQGAGLQQAGALGQLGSLGSLNQLGLSPFGAQFAPLQGLAGILGDPTVLNSAMSATDMQSTASSRKTGGTLGGFGGLLGGIGGALRGVAMLSNPGAAAAGALI